MTDSERVTIEYVGSSIHLSLLLQELRDEGLEFEYEAPESALQHRFSVDPSAVVDTYLAIEAWAAGHPLASGAAAAVVTAKVQAVIAKWTKNGLSRYGNVSIKDDE
ncbi:hypothetical protein [Kineosporia babensis]|uniref:Uncharacterized protein n=1 Tax=Kineosporia babensis TaxID=499548 RepID=A0A9X1ND45_9ACTN|nr:hypothetical protein [Kineosporia babensis]MCD5310833.1 hypothetical protein [Kineosporia babensis]